jgi:hypothetical protein
LKFAAAILALAAIASACAGQRRAPRSEGERLYMAKCTSCHSYEPHEYTAARWSTEIDEMERTKKVTLQPEQRALILGYLTGSQAGQPQAVQQR